MILAMLCISSFILTLCGLLGMFRYRDYPEQFVCYLNQAKYCILICLVSFIVGVIFYGF